MGQLISRFSLWFFLFFLAGLSLFSRESFGNDTIKAEQSINESSQTLVSVGRNFELGFFTPLGSEYQYLGIWYKKMPQTVVWVANRDNPLVNSSGVLKFNNEGNIILLNQTGGVLWSSSSPVIVTEPVAQLLDTGNFVLRASGSEDLVWQSFEHPSDTLLPGMKLGWDLKTGLNRKLTSWKSSTDASSGEFTYSIDTDGLPQFVVHKGSVMTFRGGPWFGASFSGSPPFRENPIYTPEFKRDSNEVTYSFKASNNVISRFALNSEGSVQHFFWDEGIRDWHILFTLPGDGCNFYGLCGDFGICTFSVSPKCDCIGGFVPKSPKKWEMFDWLDGCISKDKRICRNGEGFKRISNLKLPDSSGQLVNVNMTVQDCEAVCLQNCSCLAYGILEVPGVGHGCVTWFHKLMDIRFVPTNGQDLFVRVAASELAGSPSSVVDSGNTKVTIALVVSAVGSLLIFLALFGFFIIRRKTKAIAVGITENEIQSQENDVEMPIYDFSTIEVATDSFSFANKIGEGGFGPVYKGKLPCGQEIAVKRLAEGSRQGRNEFKNEVILISKLQHRNLVNLFGFCIHQEETLLIYEYMPNKSLNYFLFDDKKRSLLNWQTRLDIIIGIARGLLYLHRDSRLRIIHRDLKVSNILLDNEMNPKISDFGMARLFGEDQTETKTKRVVGTYGYMAPEYAIDGCFSLKSDVFSFGVILLEIVSGKKNRGFFHPDHQFNLLGHAWKLWDEGNGLELLDVTLKNEFQNLEVRQCIQVGLLCVQQDPEERPSMWSVLCMLESENMLLPHPKRPGFYTERIVSKNKTLSGEEMSSISNEATVTLLHGR